jgi:valyl-tRNA synthetase
MPDLRSATRHDPAEAEPRILDRWLAHEELYHPEPEGTADENYSIAIPPPNVTGALHMGHALNSTVQDTLIRHHRMLGRRAKWIFGTDHAGIATQAQVEKQLAREGTSRAELGRERFVERVWEWREQYGSTIIDQLKRLGATCDFFDERFTLDPAYAEAVLRVFVELFEQGLIYRDRYLVNWDPGTRSAISDLEVEDREVTDTLYFVDYPLASGSGAVTVATVRPETMLADTAIAVHPDDERYERLVGETAILPIVGRRLKIIADSYVKPEFGTGALKITPGHDPNDFEIGRAHGLEEITVIGEDGRMTAAAGEDFAGRTVLEAREAVVARLEEGGLLVRRESYQHTVPVSHRSGERIEPLISLQWFMRMDELAGPAIEAVREGRIRIVPERWAGVYLDWLQNIRPWCISRQLWWGHQIPVWYRGEEVYAGIEPPEGPGWERDPDVLDTWFSSALWPFATLGWPEDTPELRAFYPTDVLVTGRDIIFLWVARMVMMGLRFPGDIPFDDVYITSIIQAPDGRRMSKSLGTGIDPLEVIESHGADAVRFGLLAMSSSQDVRFSEDKVAQGQQLANKLWNASRFVLLGADGAEPDPTPRAVEDRWILSRLERAKTQGAAAIEGYEFHHAALGLYDFVYGELCDWYLEWVKGRDDAHGMLLHVLRETLAIAHPIIPFVTEAIWEHLPGADPELVALARRPAPAPGRVDEVAEETVGRAIAAVGAVRSWRERSGVRPGARLPARLDAEGYENVRDAVARLARLDFAGGDSLPPVASIAVPGGTIEVAPSDDLDRESAERRLAERRDHLEAEIARAERKVANEGFVAKAPPEVVQAERDKLDRLRRELEAL